MLIDTVTITIKAGKGGDGKVSFRHLPKNYKGGPDGGNGGNGGNVYLQGIDDILGLRNFQFRKEVKAEDGIPGGKKNLFGKNGKDLIVKLPIGTLVTNNESGEQFEIVSEEDKILVAKGGKGGRGNNEFKTPTDQAPHYAEQGTPGEVKEFHLELKLIADVGFIGLPNAGKSSLLAILTNAHPKIGNYPFTTLEPNIGMLETTTLADIPGLIEGAHEGRGLGIQFLRHVEKTQVLVHCISVENDDVYSVYQTIRAELKEYNAQLLKKPEIVLLTKTDLVSKEDAAKKIKELKKTKKSVFPISLYDADSVDILKKFLIEHVEKK